MIAEGSHTQGVRDFEVAYGPGGMEVRSVEGDSWVGDDFQLGDAVIFNTMTVHKAMPNLTDRLRISMDCRYQPAGDPITRDCIELDGNPLTWSSIYSGWRSSGRQYYWRSRKLNIVPFDWRYHEKRDALAIAAAKRGDRRCISSLQRIMVFDPDAKKRALAESLLNGLDAAAFASAAAPATAFVHAGGGAPE